MAERPLPLLHPAFLLATWFGAGLLPAAPGTWGSLAALPFAWIIGGRWGPGGLVVASAIIFGLGCWAADVVARASGEKDAGAVVIDEVAAQWLVLAVAPPRGPAHAPGFPPFPPPAILNA